MSDVQKQRTKKMTRSNARAMRFAVFTAVFGLVMASVGLVFLLKTKEILFIWSDHTPAVSESAVQDMRPAFPLSVFPREKRIIEDPAVESFVDRYLAITPTAPIRKNWFTKLTNKLAQLDWYQNLASPTGRILVIESGERYEQVADNFAQILRWDEVQRDTFVSLVASSTPALAEGKFYPDHYVVAKDATPETVAQMVLTQFKAEVADRYSAAIAEEVPLHDALTIASLLEREAYSFADMRLISGVVWNRLFIDMPLQLDASLQYAKGSYAYEPWWPKVVPEDKYIDSPFNTYMYGGLPPTPIANPSVAAVVAALNPVRTDCFFYFHDAEGGFHCSVSYEEHVAKLKEIYGQGR